MKKFFIFISPVIFITACDSNVKENLMPGLANADSVAIMYYNTPNDPRFFKYVKEYDKQNLKAIVSDANSKVVKEKKECETQGKIYFYGKNGVVDVVYFTNTDDCMIFSFILTGEKYFVRMSDEANDYLNKLKPNAKEPVSTS